MTPDPTQLDDQQPQRLPHPTRLQLYSTKEAARFLGLSHRTLEDWRCSGTGPRFIMIHRMVRYRADDLAAFLDRPSFANTGQAQAA